MELPRHLADLDADAGVINLTVQFFKVPLLLWVVRSLCVLDVAAAGGMKYYGVCAASDGRLYRSP